MSESVIRAHYNSAKSLTHQMKVPTDAQHFDDLVQEGAIAAWLATNQHDRTDPIVYGMVAAKRRIQGQLAGRLPMYGSERKGGRVYDLHRQEARREAEAPDSPSPSNESDLADLRLDLLDALGALSETDLRLAQCLADGLNWVEVGEALCITSNAAQKRWRTRVRPALQERLSQAA